MQVYGWRDSDPNDSLTVEFDVADDATPEQINLAAALALLNEVDFCMGDVSDAGEEEEEQAVDPVDSTKVEGDPDAP